MTATMTRSMTQLHKIRSLSKGAAITKGLSDTVIQTFLKNDPKLAQAIDMGVSESKRLQSNYPDLFKKDERDLLRELQSDFLNFYGEAAQSPYIPIAACGPWVITSFGAVMHDSGGYGMIGFGHSPEKILEAMCGNQVMANIMTPSVSHKQLSTLLKTNIGLMRKKGYPYDAMLMMNSGSEAMVVATRITDAFAKVQTDPGTKHAGKKIKFLSLTKSFHGRTSRPARVSDSTRAHYKKFLASYRDDEDKLITVDPNNIKQLEAAFADAAKNNVYISACYFEPVMGEGNPGMALTPEFYKRGRELTLEHDAILVIDSIQAGIRAHGVLSITDYPGFETLPPPDMESFSKAVNGGQYPLSILVMTHRAKDVYKKGLYGNTMTGAPRACDIAISVLDLLTDKVRRNIVDRGREFLKKLHQLSNDLPGVITQIQGTGLLLSAQLKDEIPVEGINGIEQRLRHRGINVIHGGHNSLRFTPHFLITSAEIDLIIGAMKDILS